MRLEQRTPHAILMLRRQARHRHGTTDGVTGRMGVIDLDSKTVNPLRTLAAILSESIAAYNFQLSM